MLERGAGVTWRRRGLEEKLPDQRVKSTICGTNAV